MKEKASFWKKLLVILPVFLMASWILAAWDPTETEGDFYDQIPQEKITINEYDFWVLEEDTYGTFFYADGKRIPIAFRLDPREAENIPLEQEAVDQLLSAEKVYITFNPNEGDLPKIAVASAELSRIFAIYSIPVKGAYSEDTDPINPDIPLKTCSDASTSTKIVMMELGEDTEITSEEGCIHLSGETEDELILAADKLGYNLMGFKI